MKTKRNRIAALAASLAVVLGMAGACAATVFAAEPQAQQPKYTRQEYDAYQAAAAEKNPQQKLKLLDDFVSKYPTSALLAFVYNDYVTVYYQLHEWAKDVEYLDKFLSLSDINDGARLMAEVQRSAIFEAAYNAKAADAKEQAAKARDVALDGLKVLAGFQKPAQMSDQDWAAKKKEFTVQFSNTAASSSLYLKDYAAAVKYFHDALEQDPQQAVDDYRMGVADLLETPPQAVAGFWAVARAIDLKVPDAEKVTAFLHDKISLYQTPGCDSLVDSQLKELLTLAQSSQDPPAGYTIPSAADLGKVREQANIQSVLADLKAGGDKAKLTWLAVCSGDFPEALAKAYEVNAATPDAIVIKAAIGITEDELNASTAANGDLKISGQPEAARLEKDAIFRFGGKLTGYTPDPFYLTWESVKVNPEDIPEEKGKKAVKKPAKKP